MMRVKWRAVWLVCWALILIADLFFDLRAQLAALVVRAETGEPSLFYSRVQGALLVVFVLVALSPLLWPLAKRWFVKDAPKRAAAEVERDPRDASLAEALGYLVDRSAWGAGRAADGSRNGDEDEAARLRAAAALIEEAARKGRLDLRGVPPGGSARRSITADHWLSAGIDLTATLDPAGTGGRTAARDAQAGPSAQAGRDAPVYDHVVVDRAALAKQWPPDNVWRRTGRATARGIGQSLRRDRKPDGDSGVSER
jgi:hypothetical protein